MNILITAGGTTEKIDNVRHLTNQATGRLGKELAEALKHDQVTIDYIYGPQAILPTMAEPTSIIFHPIRSVMDLYDTMEHLLTEKNFDFVVHSMAVSDYKLSHIANEQSLATTLAAEISQKQPQSEADLIDLIQQSLVQAHRFPQPTSKKIDSSADELILFLEKAPKVIQSIKKWQPNTTLIGFKLLVGVTEEHLVEVAQNSLTKNHADYILANDLEHITDISHLALLVDSQGIAERFTTKVEIAQGLRQVMLNKKEN
ncbi:hypothetical protein CBF34_09415 [Vagococcus penaei]|uniref:DNA/pantothenate metabolism flavoprotein C-terminal domain-containing protein n=1 Tax=Vagococcus penaei TaxID=633807 RepID=A0A1Q2D6C0_9ENTE|nr:phosphopantothenoylcysteine decarboxylase [Vagococcus penaei]AQP53986.1 hypothetical protein BW732_07015 [Vagococcus penaei]RST99059.1 hypothetical protein CBF34_09415 [Vagococcus penaei]